MFERAKIVAAAAKVARQVPGAPADKQYILDVVSRSPFLNGAVQALKHGMMRDKYVAVVYLLAAGLDAAHREVGRLKDQGVEEGSESLDAAYHRIGLCDAAASEAAHLAGARGDEVEALVDSLVEMHTKSDKEVFGE